MYRILAGFILLFLPFSVFAASGTVVAPAFAWGENMGWINFAPEVEGTYHGLVVTDSDVTGYAWSSGAGWIQFSPETDEGGVTNTRGVLSGYAWSETLGWLSMSGVTIDSSGVLHGTAGVEGSPAGRISFGCDHCSVVTTWRPPESEGDPEPTPAPNRSLDGGGFILPQPLQPTSSPDEAIVPPVRVVSEPIQPRTSSVQDPIAAFYASIGQPLPASRASTTYVEAYNKPLTVRPAQSGLLVTDFGGGIAVAIEIPADVSEKEIAISATASKVSNGVYGNNIALVDDVAFSIVATDSEGKEIHQFSHPLKITFVLPHMIERKAAGVFWYNETAKNWIEIPDAVITGTTATVSVGHLTQFAVLHSSAVSSAPTPPLSFVRSDIWMLCVSTLLAFCIGYALWFFFRTRARIRR